MVFVGIDWAKDGHDVALQSIEGKRLRDLHIGPGVGGLARLQEALAEFEEDPAGVMVAIARGYGRGAAAARSLAVHARGCRS